MPNALDLLRSRRPAPLACSATFLNRGLSDARYDKLNYPKALAAMLRHVRQRQPDIQDARIVVPCNAQAYIDAARAHLADWPDLRFAPDIFSSLLDDLAQVSCPSVFAFCGNTALPNEHEHRGTRLGRSLAVLAQRTEAKLLRTLMDQAAAEDSDDARRALFEDTLVVEEQAGRCFLLPYTQIAQKAQFKKWQALLGQLSKDRDSQGRRALLTAEAGFGFGAVALQAPRSVGSVGPGSRRADQRQFQLASADFRLPETASGAVHLPAVVDGVSDWLNSIGAPSLAELRQIYLAVPWLSAAAAWADALKGKVRNSARLIALDLLLGWHPSLSLTQMLASAAQPALLVHGGRPRHIHVVVLWT